MVIEQVECCSTDVVILRFNPWICSDPKQLITQFFKQLASAIKMKKPAADTMCELVDQYADIFDAANLIPYAGTAIAAAGKVFSAKARNRMKQKNNDMQGQKDEIVRKMVEENLKIIVSIDILGILFPKTGKLGGRYYDHRKFLINCINVKEAYSRIDVFVTTREFLLLPKETQKDVVAFLIAMANNKKSRPTEGLVAEEIIQEELQKRVNAIQRIEV